MRVVVLRKQVGTDNISADTLKEEVLSRIRDKIGDLELTQVLELFRAAGADVGDVTIGNASELSDKLLGAAQGMELGGLLALARKLGVDVGDIEEQIRRVAEAAQQLAGAGVGPAYGRLYKQIMEEEDNPRAKGDKLAAAARRLAGLLSSCSSWDDLASLSSATKMKIVETAGTLRRLLDELEDAFTTLGVYGSTYWDRIRPREWGGQGPSLEEIGRSDR
jgi:hypothetical protein